MKRGLIDFKQASRILKVDRFSLYRKSWAGKLPFVKIGGRKFIPASKLGEIKIKGRGGENYGN